MVYGDNTTLRGNNKNKRQLWLSLPLCLIYSATNYAQPLSTEAEQDITIPEWVEIGQSTISDQVHDVSSYLDHSMAKDEDEKELINNSYLKIRLTPSYSYRDKFEFDTRASLKVDLPHTKQDWNLILETDPDDFDSLESKQRNTPTNGTSSFSEAVGGVRVQDLYFGSWKTNFDVGIKFRFPLDPFVRADIRRVDALSDNWTSRFKQELFYYHSKGPGSLTELDFYYAFKEDHSQIFKSASSAQYLENDDTWELVQTFTYFDRVSRRNLMEYSVGISSETDELKKVSNIWLSASWKRNLYKNWLYTTLTPQIEFPREHNHHINPGVWLELEILFSKNRKMDQLLRTIPTPYKKRIKDDEE